MRIGALTLIITQFGLTVFIFSDYTIITIITITIIEQYLYSTEASMKVYGDSNGKKLGLNSVNT